MTDKIQKVENGYLVFSPARLPDRAYPSGIDMWVFETFESLAKFLQERFEGTENDSTKTKDG